MKKTITILFLLISCFIFSQEFQFEEVVKVDSIVPKDKLYNKIKNWIATNYNSKVNKIIVDNQESGNISAIGIYNYRTEEKYKGKACVEGPVKYVLNIYVKDGKYKYVFHSFEHRGSHGSGCRPANYGLVTNNEEAPDKGKGIQYNLGWQDLKVKLNEFSENQALSLKKSIETRRDETDNW